MSRDARAGLVGAAFGLVFVLVNAGDLPAPYDVVVRVLGVVAFVAVFVILYRYGGDADLRDVGPRGWRIYWTAVVAEVIALVAGANLLVHTGHEELSLPWVVLVVGVHFFPLAWAFGAPFYHLLGAVLVALAVAAGALAVGDAGQALVSFVSGVCAGFVLMGFALRPALHRD